MFNTSLAPVDGVSVPAEPEERDVRNIAANIRRQLTADNLEYKQFMKHYGMKKQFVEAARRFSKAHGTAEECLIPFKSALTYTAMFLSKIISQSCTKLPGL